jgi:hypothetical protein
MLLGNTFKPVIHFNAHLPIELVKNKVQLGELEGVFSNA